MKRIAINIPKQAKAKETKKITINFPPESVLDYEEVLELGKLPMQEIAKEVAEYIKIRLEEGKRVDWYFRLKYLDETTDTMLKLFIKQKGELSGRVVWNIVGIMLDKDYDQELADDGIYKFWYDTKIDFTGEEAHDWVEVLRYKQEQKQKELEALYGKD